MHHSPKEAALCAVAEHLGIDISQIRPGDRFDRDLGLLPLDVVLIALRLEDIEGVELPIERLEHIHTVAELTALLRATVVDDIRTTRALAAKRRARASSRALARAS